MTTVHISRLDNSLFLDRSFTASLLQRQCARRHAMGNHAENSDMSGIFFSSEDVPLDEGSVES
jgi:hypothetical protein